MGKKTKRPTFTTEPSSRSTSRDRYDLEAARTSTSSPPSSQQHQQPHTSFSSSNPPVSYNSVIPEESVLDSSNQEATHENENQPLLNRTEITSPNAMRQPMRLASMYGSTTDRGSPHYISLPSAPPLGLLKRNESIFKLSGMIDDNGGEYEKFRMTEEEMKPMKKHIRAFYEMQNEILDGFLEVDEILDNTRSQAQATSGGGMIENSGPLLPIKPSAAREEAFNSKVKLAINVNFLINFLLLGGKIGVVLLSNSMSLIASTVDSAMDFLSTVIIFGTNRVIEHRDWRSVYNYPTGKKRMEPMGIVVFSVMMISSFLQVFIESIQRLLDPNLQPAEIPLTGIIVMLITIVVKVAVWVWCKNIRNSSVEALAQDAENDIVFNFFSLLFPFIGQKLGWRYLDPLGGAMLSVYIIVEWTSTLLENVTKLTGKRASPQQHQRVAYLLTRFSPLIKAIQHLSVYHAGDHFIVETDVVLDSDTDLTVAHNVAESAQYGLEQLEMVDRAFVHVDVTVNPLSGHVAR